MPIIFNFPSLQQLSGGSTLSSSSANTPPASPSAVAVEVHASSTPTSSRTDSLQIHPKGVAKRPTALSE